MVNLTDSTGEIITSNSDNWYKIMLHNGNELGLGQKWPIGGSANDRTKVQVVPAGSGMVFRYQRADGDNRAHQGWPIGDKGYLRGLQVKADRTEVVRNMSLSAGPVHLCMYNNHDNYGMVANQLPGNRVALYGYDGSGKICGLRVTPDGDIVAYESDYALALDCQFVKVSSGRFSGTF